MTANRSISETTGPIYSQFQAPFDSAYAISSAIFNMVTSWVTVLTLKGHLNGFPYDRQSWSRKLLDRFANFFHQSTQRMRFHQPYWTWWPWVTVLTLKGQLNGFRLWPPILISETTEPIFEFLSPIDSAYAISSAVLNLVTFMWPSVTLKGQKYGFLVSTANHDLRKRLDRFSRFLSPFDSAYAISSAVFNMVTFGDRRWPWKVR